MSGEKQTKERVLFVDDEQRVLDALRRMLRPLRHEWDMDFVTSGKEALEVLSVQPVSVVITDMRMPQMDGAQFLEEVSARRPETVRIVLSGHSDTESVYRSMNKAHQYLSKPCDGETIRGVIRRACRLRDMLADERLKHMLSRMTTLPSLPAVYTELVRELQQEEVSLPKVGEIISSDVSMTAKVLQLVNSAWFALNRTITELGDAVLMLGTETLKNLVLSAHVFAQLEAEGAGSELVHRICGHSVQVAHLAKNLALFEGADRANANYAFMAGMMHEVGLLVLVVNDPKAAGEALQLASAEGISTLAAERRVLNATHAQMGAYLLGLWGLPSPIQEAVAFVDDPSVAAGGGFSPLAAVHVADALIHSLPDPATPGHEMDLKFLESIGLADHIPEWNELLNKSLEDEA